MITVIEIVSVIIFAMAFADFATGKGGFASFIVAIISISLFWATSVVSGWGVVPEAKFSLIEDDVYEIASIGMYYTEKGGQNNAVVVKDKKGNLRAFHTKVTPPDIFKFKRKNNEDVFEAFPPPAKTPEDPDQNLHR